jgi:hypothetical protein
MALLQIKLNPKQSDIGRGSNTRISVASRKSDYESGNAVSRRVRKAIQIGYTITHKGLLRWEPSMLGQMILRFPHFDSRYMQR